MKPPPTKTIAAAENCPEVAKARAALAALQAEPTPPAPPFRGKVKVDAAGELLAAMGAE